MTSEIRANTIKNRVGLGTVSFTNTGSVVSGIVTANTLRLPDSTSGSLGRVQLGNGLDLSLFHNGSNSFLINNTGYLSIQSQDGVNGIFIARNAEVNLYFGSSVRLQTSSSGVTINRDLDVDGHTNLDNVSVAGVSTFTGAVTAHDYRSGGGVGNTLYLTSADDWRFRTTGGSERLRIDSGGRIGLGIANPDDYFSSYNRVVMGRTNDTGGMTIVSSTTSGGYISFADGTSGNQAYRGMIAYQHSGDYMTFGTDGGNEKMRITSGGDVIIGSGGVWSYPKPLNVQGSSGSILSLYNADTTSYAADTFSGIEFKLLTGNTGTTNAACEIRAFKENGTNGNSARALSFYTGVNGGSPTERLRISSDGKVGIGNVIPDELLHIFSASGNSKIVLEADNNSANNGIYWVDEGDSTQSEFYYDHGGNKQHLKVNGNGFEIYSKQTSKVTAKIGHGSGYNDVVVPNGKLGVGTDNAGTTLDVFGFLQVKDSTGKLNMQVDGGNGTFKVFQSPSSWTNMNYTSTPILAWDYKNGPGDLFYIGSGGNTPIADQMAIVVSDAHGVKIGKSGYDGSDFDISSSNEFFRINTSGNVVIGHTAANAKLQINSGTNTAVGDATNPAFQIGGTTNYRFAVHTTNEQAIIANKNGDDGIAFHTKTAGGSSFGQAFLIDANNNLKHGTSTPLAFNSSNPSHTQRFLGKKCMQGCITATITLDSNGNGTFDLGKIWLTDDSSCELFMQVMRNDNTSGNTHYAKAFIQKVRGTGMSDGHILYQNGVSGFSITSIVGGGYAGTGHSSHGTRITVTGGAGGVIYRATVFYTTLSKNDMY